MKTCREKIRRTLWEHGVEDQAAKGSAGRGWTKGAAALRSSVATEYGVETERLRRARASAAAARQAALWALTEQGLGRLRQRELGEIMGGISASAVAHARKRQTASMKSAKGVCVRLARIAQH